MVQHSSPVELPGVAPFAWLLPKFPLELPLLTPKRMIIARKRITERSDTERQHRQDKTDKGKLM